MTHKRRNRFEVAGSSGHVVESAYLKQLSLQTRTHTQHDLVLITLSKGMALTFTLSHSNPIDNADNGIESKEFCFFIKMCNHNSSV